MTKKEMIEKLGCSEFLKATIANLCAEVEELKNRKVEAPKVDKEPFERGTAKK